MAMRATTRETALTGFRFMSLGRGHIFGTGVDSRSCEPFGGMFMILFCRKLFSVKFNLLAGEPSATRCSVMGLLSRTTKPRNTGHGVLTLCV